jgi:carbonic anhydrase/acetyltransferase-like protein (isoleucine patch superfamily)
MPCLIPIAGVQPQLPRFLAPNATLVGDVRFGRDCSVWFNVVLRADINRIEVGDGTNIQDNSVLLVSRQRPCILGAGVSVGHLAVCHACTVGDGTLVGMGAKILDGAVIGRDCVVAAGAVVPEGLAVPDGMVVAGVPARVLRPVDPAMRERFRATARNYAGDYQALYPGILADGAAARGAG